MDFQPDYRNLEMAASNKRPPRLPLYEHCINVESMELILGKSFGELVTGNDSDLKEFFTIICEFWRSMTYDTVSYEVCLTSCLPAGGALLGEHAGPIQTRSDFEKYPWGEVRNIFWQLAGRQFELLREVMPPGMKAVGGIGNGIFEISEDLVGYEDLCYMGADDPELFANLCQKIGDLLVSLWREFLDRYGDDFVVCRIGDDMGFKTATLLSPSTLVDHIVPQYRRLTALVHQAGKPFLLHSCGRIFDIMEPLIEAGIDAKHSNEDAIAPFGEWIKRYGDRIALFGGIDTDRLCRMPPEDIYAFVIEHGTRFRREAIGFALGSGNSIPPYVPRESYLAMVRAAKKIRKQEQ